MDTYLQQIQSGNAILLDVRTPEEFAEAHAEAAQLFSLQQLEVGELPTAPKDTRIYVYCRSGGRAGSAMQILAQNGFTQLMNLGGLSDLEALGAKIIR